MYFSSYSFAISLPNVAIRAAVSGILNQYQYEISSITIRMFPNHMRQNNAFRTPVVQLVAIIKNGTSTNFNAPAQCQRS